MPGILVTLVLMSSSTPDVAHPVTLAGMLHLLLQRKSNYGYLPYMDFWLPGLCRRLEQDYDSCGESSEEH